ncbi:DUF2975 domain-containing protein [Agromyces sp. NPDC057679]|uniref:DUF2975 domain-containing protein n=1 Tax=Agromyces sp. NPDC057679 TaxID=3346207 RepID=UPI0036721CD6
MESGFPRLSLAVVVVTQSLIAVGFLGGAGFVIVAPGLSAAVAASLPEFAALREPLLATTIAFTVLGLIVLTMVALLVQRVHRGTVMARTSLRCIEVIVAASVGAIVVVVVGSVVIGNAQAGSPILALLQAAAVLALVVLARLALIFRSRLRRALSTPLESAETDWRTSAGEKDETPHRRSSTWSS